MSALPSYRFPPTNSTTSPNRSQYGIASQLRAPSTGIHKSASPVGRNSPSFGRNSPSPSPVSFLRQPSERKGSLRKPPPSLGSIPGQPNLGAAIELDRGISTSNGFGEGKNYEKNGMGGGGFGGQGGGMKGGLQWEERGGAEAVLAHGVTNPTKFRSPWTTPPTHSRIASSIDTTSPHTSSPATLSTNSSSTVPGVSPALDVQLGQQKGSFYASIGSPVASSSARSSDLLEEDFDPNSIVRTASVSVARRESFVEGVTQQVRSRLVPLPLTPTPANQRTSAYHRPTTSQMLPSTPPSLYRGSSKRTPTRSPLVVSTGFDAVRPLMHSATSNPSINNDDRGPKGESPSTNFPKRMSAVYPSPTSPPISPIRQIQQPKYSTPLSPAPLSALPPRPQSAVLPAPPPSTTTHSQSQKAMNSTRLPMRTMSIASRTAHLSARDGYAWRVKLCDELERLNPGMFISVLEIESIISMEEIPTTTKRSSWDGASTAKPGFFSKIKRSFGSTHEADHLPESSTVGQTRPSAPYSVFGVPLSVSTTYASCEAIIDGSRQLLPIVVCATGEEIYRRGMRTPGLMKLAGESSRVTRLMEIYNGGPDYGDSFDLSLESIHVVTSLLIRFLRDLPEPILDQRLWRLYVSCSLESPRPLAARIGSAKTILLLLPPANFSLLVYLLAFLSQLSIVSPARLTVEQISVIFGPAVFSARVNGPNNIPVSGSVFGTVEEMGPKVTVKRAQDALCWLLKHWTEVSDNLLETSTFRPDEIDPPVRKPLPTLRQQPPPAARTQLSAPRLIPDKSFRRRSSLPISSLDQQPLSIIQERRKSSLPRIEDVQSALPYSQDHHNPQSFAPSNSHAVVGLSPRSTAGQPWTNEDRRREELGLIPRVNRNGSLMILGGGRGGAEERGESSLDSDGMISSTRSWGSTAPSSTEPTKDHYSSNSGMQERSVLDDLLELDDSSAYSASAAGHGSSHYSPPLKSHDQQQHRQSNYDSYQTSPFSDQVEHLRRDSVISHRSSKVSTHQSAEIKRLWTDLEQSERMRDMAVGEVERLRVIAKDVEQGIAREQRRVEMELRNEVELLSRQLQSIRGILAPSSGM